MKNQELNKYIVEVGNDAFKRLKELNIPPYPKYYQDSFKEFLKEIKNKEIDTLIKKNSYLVEPITDAQDSKMVDNCYNIAKESIKEFSKTNEHIKKSSIDLSKITKDLEDLDNSKLLESFNDFHKKLIKTLKEADTTIIKLQEEILQLEKESNIDPLTKLYNKRALLRDLETILDFGKDKKLDLSLIIFDLDDFKKINDTFGHIAGDKTLIYVAKVLKNSLRSEVKTYRFGGEEFVVVLNRIDLAEAQNIAKRILKTISESKLIYKNSTIKITMSGGITDHRQNDTIDTIIERADRALYKAKESGKNKVVTE